LVHFKRDPKDSKGEDMSIKREIAAATMLLLLAAVPAASAQHDQQGGQPGNQHPQGGQASQPGQSHGQPQGQHGQPQPGKTQPAAQPAPRQAAQPAPRSPAQPTARPVQTTGRTQSAYGGAYHGGVKPTEPTNGGVHPSGVPQAQSQVRSGFLQSRAGSWQTDHRTWQQRGGYSGYRVPDDRFRLYFGTGHFFHIGSLPLLFVGGYPRFQYDGYWVTLMDPWPENWPPLWYETDNVYVDWGGDGYYLYDTNYPGIAIAVTLSF
jgi:hypothetical protein